MVLTKGEWCDQEVSKRSHHRKKGRKEGLGKRGLGMAAPFALTLRLVLHSGEGSAEGWCSPTLRARSHRDVILFFSNVVADFFKLLPNYSDFVRFDDCI